MQEGACLFFNEPKHLARYGPFTAWAVNTGSVDGIYPFHRLAGGLYLARLIRFLKPFVYDFKTGKINDRRGFNPFSYNNQVMNDVNGTLLKMPRMPLQLLQWQGTDENEVFAGSSTLSPGQLCAGY